MDFDADRIYYSHQNLQQQQQQQSGGEDGDAAAAGRLEDEEDRAVDSNALRRHYREFLSKLYYFDLHLYLLIILNNSCTLCFRFTSIRQI